MNGLAGYSEVVLIHDKSTDELCGALSLTKHSIKGIKQWIDRNYGLGEFVVIKGSSPVQIFFERYIARKAMYERRLAAQMDFCHRHKCWTTHDLLVAKMKLLRKGRS